MKLFNYEEEIAVIKTDKTELMMVADIGRVIVKLNYKINIEKYRHLFCIFI